MTPTTPDRERLDLSERLGVPGVRVAVSTRAAGSTGFSGAPDPAPVTRARKAFLRAAGAARPDRARGLHQVHGGTVVTVRPARDGVGGLVPDPAVDRADALVTTATETPLLVLGADCVVGAVAAADGTVVGAFHAGWRGTAAGIVEGVVAAAGEPAALRAVLGPAIGPCCYEVGPEVVTALGAAAAPRARPGPRGRPHLDLRGVVADRLVAAGVPAAAVATGGGCTRCERIAGSPRWWSHRGGDAGRHLLAAWRTAPAGG